MRVKYVNVIQNTHRHSRHYFQFIYSYGGSSNWQGQNLTTPLHPPKKPQKTKLTTQMQMRAVLSGPPEKCPFYRVLAHLYLCLQWVDQVGGYLMVEVRVALVPSFFAGMQRALCIINTGLTNCCTLFKWFSQPIPPMLTKHQFPITSQECCHYPPF